MPQAITSVPAVTNGWTDLGTIIPIQGSTLSLGVAGTINYGSGTCDANGAAPVLGADPTQFNVLLTMFASSFAYAFVALVLPVGMPPQNDPSHGGIQYREGVLIPGIGPRFYTRDEVLYTGSQLGAGPWKLWGRCNDYGPEDNSGAWAVTTVTPPHKPVFTSVTPSLVGLLPQIEVRGT